ncbi:MAG: 6-phosphogluconolactonase [Magnetococcales bacterium]|nr:6-phosphogluconolactonase [Magnetococcales bacterium]
MPGRAELFADAGSLARGVGERLRHAVREVVDHQGRPFYLALSGGETPRGIFRTLAESPFRESIPWERIRFFWGDERCVGPDHPESNFAQAKRLLLDPLGIPEGHIFRMRGEDDPEAEVLRYATLLREQVPIGEGGIPRMDCIWLGLGQDGHTASLFPGNAIKPPDEERICHPAVHPESGENRLTLGLSLIKQAGEIWFLVVGAEKAEVVLDLFDRQGSYRDYPASLVTPRNRSTRVRWLLDREAASGLNQEGEP